MEKTEEILEAEITVLKARLEIMEHEARKEIARLERENRELKKQNKKSARELAEWKARAERAEQFWGERQGEVADLAHKLQNEKFRSGQIEADCMKKMILRPNFIVDTFCGILGITREELLADSNFRWEEKIKRALSEYCVATK